MLTAAEKVAVQQRDLLFLLSFHLDPATLACWPSLSREGGGGSVLLVSKVKKKALQLDGSAWGHPWQRALEDEEHHCLLLLTQQPV